MHGQLKREAQPFLLMMPLRPFCQKKMGQIMYAHVVTYKQNVVVCNKSNKYTRAGNDLLEQVFGAKHEYIIVTMVTYGNAVHVTMPCPVVTCQ